MAAGNNFLSGDDLFTALSDPSSFHTFLETLGDVDFQMFEYDGFNIRLILNKIIELAIKAQRTKVDMYKDIIDMVVIAISRGNIRKDQLKKTSAAVENRIKELATIYDVSMRANATVRNKTNKDSVTFVRIVSVFPHVASFVLISNPTIAKPTSNGLKSNILPVAMRHSGFAALIPNDEDLLSFTYLLAFTAYMIDFGRTINGKEFKGYKEAFNDQKIFCNIAKTNSVYTDLEKKTYLRVLKLCNMDNFKIILEVANNLLKELGKAVLTLDSFNSFIKNDIVIHPLTEIEEKSVKKKMDMNSGTKAKAQEPEVTVATDAFTQFKHLLLPITDRNPYLSDGTKQAISTVTALAKKYGADITVVVIDEQLKESLPEHETQLSSIRWHISEGGFKNYSLLERLGEGSKPTAIIGEVADDLNLDLVVISMEAIHTKHVDANLLAEFIPCPVMLLPL